MKNKIIIDTDPGIDDAMAILFAHASDKIDIIGITTVFGNATIENATRNALFIKNKFGLHADIAMGANHPLFVDAGEPTTFVHGENGLGNIPIPIEGYEGISPKKAHDYMIDKIKSHPGEITIITVGRLTNLALALKKEPAIAELVKEIIIMGGAFGYHGHTGNVTPFAEANIIGDPHAADITLTANWPVTIIGLDVTQQTIMSNEYIKKLRVQSPKYGEFIYQITRFYADFHRKEANLEGFYVHDSSAIAYAINPELFKKKKGYIRVITEGVAIGHTILKTNQNNYPVDNWSNNPQQQVCVDVKSDLFLDLYMETLTK